MNILTSAQDFELTPAIDQYARHRLYAALGRIDGDVVAVDIFMRDANGPRGGIDKQVVVRATLRNRRVVPVVATHADLYTAIAKAAKRTKRAVRRRLAKTRRYDRLAVRDWLTDPDFALATND